jgi:hypothetical protein
VKGDSEEEIAPCDTGSDLPSISYQDGKTSTSTLQWMPHFSIFDPPCPVASQNIPTLRFPTSTPSTSTLSASATRPTPTLSPSHHQILDLQADIKEVLERVVASHQEQKKISKDVDGLATKVKVLERVLCGDVGHPKKKRKNTDSDAVNRGGMAHRLVKMESAMDELLGLVTSLKTTHGMFLRVQALFEFTLFE